VIPKSTYDFRRVGNGRWCQGRIAVGWLAGWLNTVAGEYHSSQLSQTIKLLPWPGTCSCPTHHIKHPYAIQFLDFDNGPGL